MRPGNSGLEPSASAAASIASHSQLLSSETIAAPGAFRGQHGSQPFTVNLATGFLLPQCPFFQIAMNHGYLPENTALGVLFPNSHERNGFSPTSTTKQ
jgi:hypothetical protein